MTEDEQKLYEIYADGNIDARNILYALASNPESRRLIDGLALLNIRGANIYRLYADCCGKSLEKLSDTLEFLINERIPETVIDLNFSLPKPIPFLDDEIVRPIEGADTKSTKPWNDYFIGQADSLFRRMQEAFDPQSNSYHRRR